jgi:hypothetical protein
MKYVDHFQIISHCSIEVDTDYGGLSNANTAGDCHKTFLFFDAVTD